MRIQYSDDCTTASDAIARAQRSAAARRASYYAPPPKPRRTAPIGVRVYAAPIGPYPQRKDVKAVPMETIELPNFIDARFPPVHSAHQYLSVRAIVAACATFYGKTMAEVLSECRIKELVRARQMAMYLAKKLTPQSNVSVGRFMGGRDHTTCLHAVRKIKALVAVDESVAAEAAAIEARIAEARQA